MALLLARADRYLRSSACELTSTSCPSELSAKTRSLSARYRARCLTLVQVCAGQRSATASKVMMSALSDGFCLRLRLKGTRVTAEKTCKPTLPFMSRGISSWPIVSCTSKSRSHSKESACRSATNRDACNSAAAAETGYGGNSATGLYLLAASRGSTPKNTTATATARTTAILT